MLTTHAPVDRKALPESLALTVLQERTAPTDYQVCLATIHQSNCTPMDNAFGAHPDHLVNLAHPDPLDLLDPKEALVPLAALAKTAALALLDPPDPLAQPAQMANPDQLEALAPTRLRAAKVTLDPKEPMENPAQEVPTATVALQEKLAQLDPVAHPAPLEAQARTEKKDPTAQLVPRVVPDRTPSTVLALTAPRNIKHPDFHWIPCGSNDFPLDSLVQCFLLYLSVSAKHALSKA